MSGTHPLVVGIFVTLFVAALGYLLPDSLAGTLIGLCFLIATYLLVLQGRAPGSERQYGLALGGLLDPEPLAWRELARSATRASAWAVGFALLCFPLFWIGYVRWYGASGDFVHSVGPLEAINVFLLQWSGVALPEEAFYRGYLQTSLDRVWRPRFKVFGAEVGAALVVTSLVFSVGHVLTEPYIGRLAVFFPSLLFGWLRAKTGGIGASMLFHAACNGFAWYLGRGYGLISDS